MSLQISGISVAAAVKQSSNQNPHLNFTRVVWHNPISIFYPCPLLSCDPSLLRTELQASVFDGINERDQTFPTWCPQQWWLLLHYCGNHGIITMLFANYLMDTDKHGPSHFVHNFMLSSKSLNKSNAASLFSLLDWSWISVFISHEKGTNKTEQQNCNVSWLASYPDINKLKR